MEYFRATARLLIHTIYVILLMASGENPFKWAESKNYFAAQN